MNKSYTILLLFLLLWIIILGIPIFWWLFPVKPVPPAGTEFSIADFYSLSEKTSYSKEDLLDRKSFKKSQLYIIAAPFGRDPFNVQQKELNTSQTRLKTQIPYSKPAKQKEKFKLNGISYTNQGKIALINNQMLCEGEKVDGAKVIKIQENSVVIRTDDEVISLKINGDSNL